MKIFPTTSIKQLDAVACSSESGPAQLTVMPMPKSLRSEERRVGKECRL